MKNAFEAGFIRQAVEQTPFTDTLASNFFTQWCTINAEINVRFIPRQQWEQLGKEDRGILYIPRDLRPWEMITIIENIDHDTTAGKTTERAHNIQKLGKLFEQAGLYLWEYAPQLNKGHEQELAYAIADEFYHYGLALQHKKRHRVHLQKSVALSQEDKQRLDAWFLGSEAYQKRLVRLGEHPSEEQQEATRKKLLRVYFKALTRQSNQADNAHAEESTRRPIQHLQNVTRRQIIKAIETPYREMITSIFTTGVQRLTRYITIPRWNEAIAELLKNGYCWDEAITACTLLKVLDIPKLQAELENVRQTGDPAKISQTELAIAKKIQRAVSEFPYKGTQTGDAGSSQPAKILHTRFVNCVGSMILGWGLLQKVGMNCLYADVPKHAAAVLVTSDGTMYWLDFTPGYNGPNCVEITPDMLEEVVDISHITEEGISFRFKEWNPYNHVQGKLNVTLLPPEIGLQLHILNNTGNAWRHQMRCKEAIAAYQQAIRIYPKHPYPYNGMGNALYDLGRYREAIAFYQEALRLDFTLAKPHFGIGNAFYALRRYPEALQAYQQAITFDPNDHNLHYRVGLTLYDLGRYREAIASHQKAIQCDPKFAAPHYGMGNALYKLQRYRKAIAAYQKFLELWDGDEYWRQKANTIIAEIEQKAFSFKKLISSRVSRKVARFDTLWVYEISLLLTRALHKVFRSNQ